MQTTTRYITVDLADFRAERPSWRCYGPATYALLPEGQMYVWEELGAYWSEVVIHLLPPGLVARIRAHARPSPRG